MNDSSSTIADVTSVAAVSTASSSTAATPRRPAVRLRTLRRDDYPALIEILRSRRLAEADFHSCLARSSEATVAVLHGRPVGVILARVDINVPKRLCLLPNRHHRHIIRALFPLLFSTAGRSGIAEMLRINRVDRRLIRGAKNRYDAEVTLFLVDERIRGGGVGGFLFDDLLERFRRVGVRRYYLFTDTGCNVGFYTRRGLTHRREEKVEWDDGGSTVFYLEEGTV